MSARIASHTYARDALAVAVGDSIALTTELDERHLISWGNLPPQSLDSPWRGSDLMNELDEPVRRYLERQHEPAGGLIWQCSLGLHPEDGGLTDDQWSAVAHHILEVAGITEPHTDVNPVRWVALRDGGRALHIIASLVCEPDHREVVTPAADAQAAIAREWTRLVEEYLHPEGMPLTMLTDKISEAHEPGDLADLLALVTDEQHGVMGDLRRFVEGAARWSSARDGAVVQYAGHRLAWAARRLHSLQRDLTSISGELHSARPPSPHRATPAPMTPAVLAKHTPGPRAR
ncbi:hypothetical protein ACFY0R_10150 [Streptomyces sp. NPDC001633]|uniref:hypothetical protein n=1 Tax=Streptomyces sp. NPDC001633 TaxID=3364595 RepID=UPI00369DB160